MQYLIIENFRDRNPLPIYRRFRDRGRLAPQGLKYVNSWVTDDLSRCYQIMECDDERLLEEWMVQWRDLTEFELIPVLSSAEVLTKLAGKL